MKKSIILLLVFAFSSLVYSQRTSAEDKKVQKKLDSLCRKSPSLCAGYGMLVGRRSVFYDLKETHLKPKERHCFDKKINYRGLINNKPVEGCYYVNTNDGLIAKRDDSNNSCLGLSDFSPGYKMSQYSMLGDSYIYEIDRRGNKKFRIAPLMEDWEEDYNTTFILGDYNAFRNGEAEKLTDQHLPAYQYKILESTQGSAYFLFAPYQAEKIPVHDYLGMFGTGYYKDQYGNTVMCLLMQSDLQNYIRIEKITEVNECFDGGDFQDMKEENGNVEREISNRNQQVLNDRLNDASVSKSCSEAKVKLVKHEKIMLEKEGRATELANSGNKLSPEDLTSLFSGNNVMDEVEKKILAMRVKLCELNDNISSPLSSPKEKQKYAEEISCIESTISKLNTLKAELQAIYEKYPPKEKGKVAIEQNTLYFSRINQIDLGCNAGKNGQIKSIPDVKNPSNVDIKKLIKKKNN